LTNSAEKLFGANGAAVARALDVLVANLGKHEYIYMPEEQFVPLIESAVPEAMKVYWTEMLYRAHAAAAVSAIRNQRWLSGAVAAADAENFPAFAGCFRGFLESATDAKHTMNLVPLTLAEHSHIIGKALAGQLNTLAVNGELENELIHFSHARRVRKSEGAPLSHAAKPAAEYIRLFEEGIHGKLKDCYSLLCEVTHPAYLSVITYLDEVEPGERYQLTTSTDAAAIAEFCKFFADTIEMLLMVGVNGAFITLEVLNRLPLSAVHTAGMKKLDLRRFPVWSKIDEAFRKPLHSHL
jgi:hypothetical protein